MKFISTRDSSNIVNFEKAVIDCLPADGGFFVPKDPADLRRWILYTNDHTPFSSIAGSLTSACINDEFSPIICETISTRAFTFEPKIKKLSERLFALELCNTPTGSHRDFGISYLVNCLETLLTMGGKNAIFLDVSMGELGASLARAMRGKKHLKAVLVYPKGSPRGLEESDFIWNGGNIYPVEVDCNIAACHDMVREVFADRAFVESLNLTVANTANIGRLMPQAFFYPFAFSRLKSQVCGDIFYAMAPGNYSNLVAGLYSWQLALPVSGFICPTTDELKLDPLGNCCIMDEMVDFKNREPGDYATPSNLERLEKVFKAKSLMLKHFLYPADISNSKRDDACRELFMKFNIYADADTSAAYAAVLARKELVEEDDACVVLVIRDHAALSCDYIKHTLGEMPEIPDFIKKVLQPVAINRPCIKSVDELKQIICSL